MQEHLRYVVVGAVVGALVGAAAGLVYARFAEKPRAGLSGAVARTAARFDRSKAMRLGWSVVALIRQLVEE